MPRAGILEARLPEKAKEWMLSAEGIYRVKTGGGARSERATGPAPGPERMLESEAMAADPGERERARIARRSGRLKWGRWRADGARRTRGTFLRAPLCVCVCECVSFP
jgi:hypothetical protein